MPRRTFLSGVAASAATILSFSFAHAQTTTATGPSISQSSGQINPVRLINGSVAASRPQNVNPLGVNFSDCTSDMTLQFNVIASNFDGSALVQVWAGTADCTSNLSRGIGGQPSCWLVGQPLAGVVVGSAASLPLTFNVRAQDLVGHQQSVPTTPTYSRVGAAGCETQSVDTAQKITVFFVPTSSSGYNLDGSQIYQYPITTDLVGPPAPANPSLSVGDTLFVVNWTPNNDADTAGYDVYIDPFPGQEGASTDAAGPEPTLVCSGGSATSPEASADATTDSGGDSSVASADASAADASCVFVQTGGSSTTGSCGSVALSSTTSATASGSTTSSGDGGDDGGSTTTTSTGVAGTSNLPSSLLVGAGSSGLTATDKSSSSYTITGLTDGFTYTVVVAAVDGSGNVGPPSTQICDSPAPVLDFWTTYRQSGGTAGGGFCALEAIGNPAPAGWAVSLIVAACALAARRRRRPIRG